MEVIDIFFIKNDGLLLGQGAYSLYVVYTNDILLFEGVDRDKQVKCEGKSISPDIRQH